MQKKIEKVCSSVLEKVTPKKGERAKIEALAEKLEKKVVSASKEFGIETQVRVEGSVAKDTWLSREPDIDIFMRVPTTIPREFLGETCLKIARKATEGQKQVERFAEHPYLEAVVEETRINVVPCYQVKQGEWLSATDRTPFHTDYVKKRLKEQMIGEVRLLKKFMKGISVYGAEIKVGGFSGYLCELLILHYESFVDTLKAFSQHKGLAIDLEGYYKGRENEPALLFNDPLIMIDPVDKRRNVASAVQSHKLYTLIAASRAFLRNPNIEFFYPQETTALSIEELKRKLKESGSTMIFLTFGQVNVVPDVLWGQLYKSQRSLRKLIELNGFKILRALPWSDEKTINMFIFELEQQSIPSVKKHSGPPLAKKNACKKFLKKHSSSLNTVSGPYIEDGRWFVEINRKYVDTTVLLKEKLKDGGRNAGVAEKISKNLHKGFKIFVNEEITAVYKKKSEFAKFLTEFLSGQPKWLKHA
ncbi:CCA tRNA nucleotidyltransferase [Candidatus Bathyarchaeota archaeon]|nr:MAG: CCA tRNA nucleotidyltransferase [Candidatus Bathyarchaeota archaeon]